MSETKSNAVISKKKNKKFRRRKLKEKVDVKALETIVFGRETTVSENISKKQKIEVIDEEFGIIEDSCLFRDNEVSDDSDSSEDINYTKSDFFPELKPSNEDFPHEEEEPKKKGVWSDADDQISVRNALNINILPKRVGKDDSYRQYLENKFTDLYKTPKWAQIDAKHKVRHSDSSEETEDSDEDDDIQRTAKRFKLKSNKLEKGFLPIKKCTHLTKDNKMKVRFTV